MSAPDPTPDLPRYTRPPVVERVVSVVAEMSQETQEERFEGWREMVEKEYPVDESLKEWLLTVKDIEGIPMLDDIQPELKITPRFAKKSAKDGWDWSIRCPAGQFTMNMHSPPGSQRSYSHLAEEFQKWFPRWRQHFGVTRVQKCEMVYLNELSAATLPAFTTEQGALEIAKVLTVFTHIPGEHEHLVPPFDCRATVLLREPAGATLSIQLSDWNTEAGKPKLLLQLRVSQEWGHDSPAMEKVAEWLDVCHRRIIERFEVLFTPEARQSFEPILPKS